MSQQPKRFEKIDGYQHGEKLTLGLYNAAVDEIARLTMQTKQRFDDGQKYLLVNAKLRKENKRLTGIINEIASTDADAEWLLKNWKPKDAKTPARKATWEEKRAAERADMMEKPAATKPEHGCALWRSCNHGNPCPSNNQATCPDCEKPAATKPACLHPEYARRYEYQRDMFGFRCVICNEFTPIRQEPAPNAPTSCEECFNFSICDERGELPDLNVAKCKTFVAKGKAGDIGINDLVETYATYAIADENSKPASTDRCSSCGHILSRAQSRPGWYYCGHCGLTPAPNAPKKTWNDFSMIQFPFVTVDGSTISFQIQDGPIKEVGVNGTQIDTLIEVASNIISSFNAKFPCEENDAAVQYLGFALDSLAERKKNREKRGVEGHDKQ